MPNYFYSQHGQQHGPVSGTDLKNLAKTGQLFADAQVWAEGSAKRVLAKNVKGLFVGNAGPVEPPPRINTTSVPADLPFSQYYKRHFMETRGPWAYGVCLGLIAILISSLLKPAIGFKGQAITLVGAVLLSLLLLSIYSLQQAVVYFRRRQRTVPDEARSRMATLGFTGFLLCNMIAMLVGAEFFTPRCGLVATLMPQLQEVRLVPTDEYQEEALDGSVVSTNSTRTTPRDLTEGDETEENQTDAPVGSVIAATPTIITPLTPAESGKNVASPVSPHDEAEQIATQITAKLKSDSVKLIPMFREYCETSSKAYLYNRHLHDLPHKLFKKKLICVRYGSPGLEENQQTRAHRDDCTKFLKALTEVSDLERRPPNSEWWLGDSEWSDGGWKSRWAHNPLDAYRFVRRPLLAQEEHPIAFYHSEFVLAAAKLRDHGAPDIIPLMDEFGQSLDMEELTNHSYELCFDLYQHLRGPYYDAGRRSLLASTVIRREPFIPDPPQPNGLTEIAGITQIVQDDFYYLGNKVIQIPAEYLPLFQTNKAGPNQVVIDGHFKYTGNTIGKNAFGASVNAELYVCDHEYCRATLRNRILRVKLSKLLPERRMNKLPFGELLEDLTRFLDEEQIEEVQEIVKTNLPVERGWVFLAKCEPTKFQGIYRTVEHDLTLEPNCRLIYPTPGKSSILTAKVKKSQGHLRIEQDGNILHDGMVKDSIRLTLRSGPISLTATGGQVSLMDVKYVEPDLTFGKVFVPPSRAIFYQNCGYRWGGVRGGPVPTRGCR